MAIAIANPEPAKLKRKGFFDVLSKNIKEVRMVIQLIGTRPAVGGAVFDLV